MHGNNFSDKLGLNVNCHKCGHILARKYNPSIDGMNCVDTIFRRIWFKDSDSLFKAVKDRDWGCVLRYDSDSLESIKEWDFYCPECWKKIQKYSRELCNSLFK